MAKKPNPEIIASDIAEGILEDVGVETSITDDTPLDMLQRRGRMARGAVAVIGGLLLGGCGLPVPLQIATWTLDGLSVLTTKKTMTDHGISMVTNQDCALWRGVVEGFVCRGDDPVTVIAERDNVVEDGGDTTPELVLRSPQLALALDKWRADAQRVVGDPNEPYTYNLMVAALELKADEPGVVQE